MTRPQAARHLGQLLAIDAVGALLDVIGDAELRDLLLKAMARAREVANAEADDLQVARARARR